MRIRELELHVHIAGEGKPFLWSHGMMSSIATEDALGHVWRGVPDHVKLVRYDARGHGMSQASAAGSDYAWSNLGLDMLALADALAIDTMIAGGASMGCATAIHAAVMAPERIKGLVLMLPPTIWEARVAQASLYRRAMKLGQAAGARLLARLMNRDLGHRLPPWLAAAQPDQARLALGAPPPAHLSLLFEGAALSDLPPRAALARLAEVPALVIGWADDATHPVASAQELQRLLPRSELFLAQGYADAMTIPERIRRFASACQ